MRTTNSPRLWLLAPAVIAVLIVAQSCALRDPEGGMMAAAPEPPRPTMNHALHLERDLACIDCHDPEETGKPALPAVETCFDCHEDLSGENERVQAYFNTIRQPDGSYKFGKLDYEPGLIVNHEGHAKYDVGCADCHGQPSAKAFSRPPPLELKARCMDCHTARGASNECATCHVETRKDRKPASHDAAFLRVHGRQAPEGWREGAKSTCSLCHEVPADCNSCHQESKPPSHREAGWSLFHGRGQSDADFDDSSCALCHQERSCVLCHQTTKPANHTTPFVRRLHGIAAAVDRQSCRTCHQQDFCNRCHQVTEPVSHRGSWGTGQQTHCVACHEPLPANGCYVCHKNTLGHAAAGPPPSNAAHTGASDPTDCLSCHPGMPHLFADGTCRSCHR